jgi:hypothetical protein
VSCKENNKTTNPWYDNKSKLVNKSIRDTSNQSLKIDKINTYKSIIKGKKGTLSTKGKSSFCNYLILILGIFGGKL